MGTIDKIIRMVIAAVITDLYAAGIIERTLGLILILFAFVFIVTRIVSFCPLYTML